MAFKWPNATTGIPTKTKETSLTKSSLTLEAIMQIMHKKLNIKTSTFFKTKLKLC
jgi:hypothetical protein